MRSICILVSCRRGRSKGLQADARQFRSSGRRRPILTRRHCHLRRQALKFLQTALRADPDAKEISAQYASLKLLQKTVRGSEVKANVKVRPIRKTVGCAFICSISTWVLIHDFDFLFDFHIYALE